jgi:hypothetical protein
MTAMPFDEAKFWARAEPEPNSGCLLWPGAHTASGYGLVPFPVRGKLQGTHRMAYRLAKGEIPQGMFVCHRCDTKACMNPDHLFLGTQFDNMRDAVSKGIMDPGRPGRSKTACKHGHEYTAATTIYRRKRSGVVTRSCRTCRNAQHRLVMRKRRSKKNGGSGMAA